MKNARTAQINRNLKINMAETALASILTLAAAFILSVSEVQAAAGGVQNCTTSTDCTIGEFLFDDSSAPISGATCTITSSYPNGSSYLASQALSGGGSDGWYYYTVNTATAGYYPTTISCTVSGDTLSIDKSFQVSDAPTVTTDNSAIASAVWGYSGKTLDSFGSLPADIWSYSARSLTSFGSLISDLWSNTARTLTGATLNSGSLATQSDTSSLSSKIDDVKTDVDNIQPTSVSSTTVNNISNIANNLSDIKNQTEQTRLLMEQVVNKPIIQNVLEDTAPPISDKIENTRAQANQLYVNNQYLTTQTAQLASSWNSMDGKDALASIVSIAGVVGESGDSSSTNTMFGQSNWVNDSWNWSEGTTIASQLKTISGEINDLESGLANYQKTPALYAKVKDLVKNSLALEKLVGTTSDQGTASTLFGKIKYTGDLASNLDQKSDQVGQVLAAYTKSNNLSSISSQMTDLQNQIIALNEVPGGVSAITKISPTNPNSVTNHLLSLKGLIDSNKKLLALGSGQTMVNVWLEVGSIIFKTVATNPSTLISQSVDIKYYLPQEIKQEDIIKTDAGLTVNYDSEKDQLYVEGTFQLSPGQSRTFSVETKDIWNYPQSQIDSLRKQADDLFQPLQKTAYYAQGVSLKSDINANLDQVVALQSSAVTPDDKIKSYRKAGVLMKSVDDKMSGMKDLVTQSSANSNLFGFVGGAQTIGVWGIIIIVAAGFIFMTIYMRTIIAKGKVIQSEVAQVAGKKEEKDSEEPKPAKHRTAGISLAKFVAIVAVSSAVSAVGSGLAVGKIISNSHQQDLPILGAATTAPVASPEPQVEESTPAPVPTASPVSDLPSQSLGTGGQYTVLVGDTPTGFLRVRQSPSGVEIGQVHPGDKLIYLDESSSWYQVQLEDGTTGWVSSRYATKE